MSEKHMYPLIVLAAAVVATFGLTMYLRGRERRVLTARRLLSDEEIYESYYCHSGLDGASVRALWHEIADVLKIAPGLLRPTDEFGKTFARTWFTNDVLESLEVKAMARAKNLDRPVDLKQIRTMDNYVRAFAMRQRESQP